MIRRSLPPLSPKGASARCAGRFPGAENFVFRTGKAKAAAERSSETWKNFGFTTGRLWLIRDRQSRKLYE
jgi:hypothetical protein